MFLVYVVHFVIVILDMLFGYILMDIYYYSSCCVPYVILSVHANYSSSVVCHVVILYLSA